MKKEKEQKKLKERGITLIALVITIILLLILAGVTLKIVLDNNFVDKAEKAVDKYSEAQKNETEQIKYFLENYLGEVDNTEGSEHRTLNGADPAYNNPIIPVGFKTSSEGANWSSIDGKTVQGWNDGLVIEDKDGNQFVWVPVDGTNVIYDHHYNFSSSITEQSLPDGVINEETQINTYGGFYIGRYEAGIPESMTEALTDWSKRNVAEIPVIKENQVVWDNISWTQAKANAEGMYTKSNVKSELITDKMWDTTCKWLENAGINVTTDSREWGNYLNAEVTGIKEYGSNGEIINFTTKTANNQRRLKTGQSDYTKRKNIYDLAGGMYEWVNAKSDIPMFRGGALYKKSDEEPVIKRFFNPDAPWNVLGFRVALFVQ